MVGRIRLVGTIVGVDYRPGGFGLGLGLGVSGRIQRGHDTWREQV